MQPLYEVGRGELAALIEVEDIGIAATPQGHLQALQAELRVKAA